MHEFPHQAYYDNTDFVSSFCSVFLWLGPVHCPMWLARILQYIIIISDVIVSFCSVFLWPGPAHCPMWLARILQYIIIISDFIVSFCSVFLWPGPAHCLVWLARILHFSILLQHAVSEVRKTADYIATTPCCVVCKRTVNLCPNSRITRTISQLLKGILYDMTVQLPTRKLCTVLGSTTRCDTRQKLGPAMSDLTMLFYLRQGQIFVLSCRVAS